MTPISRTLVPLLCSAALIVPAVAQQAPSASPDAAARAQSLTGRMTKDEKLRIVHGLFPPNAKERHADMIPSAGYVPGVPRLGIATLRESDASLGVANQVEQRKGDTATALPSSLALAASFEPDLAYRSGAMIGAEARAKSFNVLLAGGVNLTRDPWGGRDFEYLGEDPLLSGVMAGESIRGVQSNHIVSTVKHYALNPQETGRHVVNAVIGEAALRESDLLAFELAIERGRPGSVMCSYNKVNGDWACENDFLLTQVLKKDWHYPGWVMSDWGAVHSTVKAVKAGLDQESGQELDDAIHYGLPLQKALASGAVSTARLDDMVRRILHGVVATGLIDHPVPTSEQTPDYAAHAAVAQEAAEKGSVLLKNAGALPLARSARSIVLIGGHADAGVLSGGGSSQVRSVGGAPVEIPLTSGAAASFARMTWHASSPLEAIRAKAPGAKVTYIDGTDPQAAAAAARAADVAIVFATQWRTEAEDLHSLSLPDGQDQLIAAVAAANPHAVVVLETGGPVLMPWLDKVGAVLEAWYPGQRGGPAIANLLFGDVDPSGKLPITFPRSEDQAPRPSAPGLDALTATGGDAKIKTFDVPYVEGAAVGYRWYAKRGLQPLFPFGYGLSYTRFRYDHLTVEGGNTLTVGFDVTNTGSVAGADVPQVYVQAGRGDSAMPRLIGFQRVALAPGETKHVTVTADPRLIADYDVARHGWHVAAGSYPVTVGHFAGDASLTGTATLTDRRMKP
ncbi:MAG: beta-glucosidase [Sphingomonas sp.]